MKLIIEIPEGMLDELNTCKFPIQDAYRLCSIIENGKPLPKDHGRLIDADALLEQFRDGTEGYDCATYTRYEIGNIIDLEDTIIEAESEET